MSTLSGMIFSIFALLSLALVVSCSSSDTPMAHGSAVPRRPAWVIQERKLKLISNILVQSIERLEQGRALPRSFDGMSKELEEGLQLKRDEGCNVLIRSQLAIVCANSKPNFPNWVQATAKSIMSGQLQFNAHSITRQ